MLQNTTIMSVQILIYVETLYVPLFIVKMVYKSQTIHFKQKLKNLQGIIVHISRHIQISPCDRSTLNAVTVVPRIQNCDTKITGRVLEARG